MLLVAHTAERLMHENISIKALLKKLRENPEHLPEWQAWLDRMIADEKLQGPVREHFHHIYSKIEGSADPSEALKALLRKFPISGKEN